MAKKQKLDRGDLGVIWSDLREVKIGYRDLITLSAKANYDIPFYVAEKIFERLEMLERVLEKVEEAAR